MKIKYFTKKNLYLGVVILLVILIVSCGIYFYKKHQDALYNHYLVVSNQELKDKQYDDAISSVNKAIEIYPKNSTGYAARAYLFFYFKDNPDEAFKDTDTALSLDKNYSFSDIFIIRGEIFKARQEYDKALEAYTQAYKISPSDSEAVHGYVSGLLYFNKGSEAYSVISKYFAEANKEDYWDNVDVWVDRAVASMSVKRCMEASTSAYHVLMRTTDDKDITALAQTILSKELNAKDCIDNDTFKAE